jgi:hypothetical protein
MDMSVTMLILVPINMSVAMLILVPINMSVAMLILILINMSIAMLILVNRYRMFVSRMTEAMFLFGVVQSRHFLVHDVSRNQHSFLVVITLVNSYLFVYCFRVCFRVCFLLPIVSFYLRLFITTMVISSFS